MTQPLRLAEGTELLGAWQGSAYTSQPWLIRRGDGQILKVSQLIFDVAYVLAESGDLRVALPDVASTPGPEDPAGSADLRELAARVAARSDRDIDGSNVAFLLRTKLAPLGLLNWDHNPAQLQRPQAILALRLRFRVVPERVHRRITTALTFLFWPPLVITALAALIAGDVWLAVARGRNAFVATGSVLDQPALVVVITVMTVVAAVIHETGHATGTRAGGATPGVMGAGIYLAWPVFYTDISDSYRLSRGGRLRADLGGVYFNALTLLAAIAAYAVTGWDPLLVFVAVTHLEVLTQFLPFVRLDGYWVVSDLVGVPNLFAYLGPVVSHLTRTETPASRARLGEIRPWARRVITGWVAATTAVLGAELLIVAWLGPRLVEQAVEALIGRGRLLTRAVDAGSGLPAVVDLLDVVFLAVPAAGLVYMGALLLGKAARAIGRWRRDRPARAVALTGAILALAVLQILTVVRGLLPSPPAARGFPDQPVAIGPPPMRPLGASGARTVTPVGEHSLATPRQALGGQAAGTGARRSLPSAVEDSVMRRSSKRIRQEAFPAAPERGDGAGPTPQRPGTSRAANGAAPVTTAPTGPPTLPGGRSESGTGNAAATPAPLSPSAAAATDAVAPGASSATGMAAGTAATAADAAGAVTNGAAGATTTAAANAVGTVTNAVAATASTAANAAGAVTNAVVAPAAGAVNTIAASTATTVSGAVAAVASSATAAAASAPAFAASAGTSPVYPPSDASGAGAGSQLGNDLTSATSRVSSLLP